MKKSDLRISLRVQVAIDAISTADFAYERIVRDAARGLSEGILRRKDFIRHRPVFDGQMIQFEADAYVLTSDEFDALVKEIRDSVAMMRPIEFHPGIIDVEDKLRGPGDDERGREMKACRRCGKFPRGKITMTDKAWHEFRRENCK